MDVGLVGNEAPVSFTDLGEMPCASFSRRESLQERRSAGTASEAAAASSPISRRRGSGAGRDSREADLQSQQHQQQEGEEEEEVDYDVPSSFAQLGEVVTGSLSRRGSLASRPPAGVVESATGARREASVGGGQQPSLVHESHVHHVYVPRWETDLYTVSYLILFSILGVLARLGLQALNTYAGAPVVFSSVWPNFAGSLVMGFLAEDRVLFRLDRGITSEKDMTGNAERIAIGAPAVSGDDSNGNPSGGGSSSSPSASMLAEAIATSTAAARRRAHLAAKKTVPLYIGLATGFCGSFTSFSSFVRDLFLALSNDLASPDGAFTTQSPTTIPSRSAGFSLLATLAVLVATVGLSLAGLHAGAHLAMACDSLASLSLFHHHHQILHRRTIDRLFVALAVGTWACAALLAALAPDRFSAGWRSTVRRVSLACVLGPPGCLLRFVLALRLNGRITPSFPLGTFAANVAGTAVLAACFDLQRVGLGSGGGSGGLAACQVLQAVMDGFCGCLTTVSTWVAELAALPRIRAAYVYGVASVAAGLAVATIVMGSVRWGRNGGWATPVC